MSTTLKMGTGLAMVALAASVMLPARAMTVHVDAAAAPGGDGSAGNPVQTIQEGVSLVPRRGGTVLVQPGVYVGPILVNRDGVVLMGDTTPIYDAAGFLEGFTDEVVITVNRKLEPEDLSIGLEPEDVVELRGSGNEVHNFVLDVPVWTISTSQFSAIVTAKAEDDDFYDDIVLSHLLFRYDGVSSADIWTRKANALIEYVTSVGFGSTGINPTGNGRADIRRAHVAHKSANVFYLGLWEYPPEENGPSLLTGSIRDSLLRDAQGGTFGFLSDGAGLLVMARSNSFRHNTQESSTIVLESTGNTFVGNRKGVRVTTAQFTSAQSTAETLIGLRFSNNTFFESKLTDVEITFQAVDSNLFDANSTIIVNDGDGVFPGPEDVDLGPVENGNSYVLVEN